METYYDPQDLGAFSEIGKDAPELANKFFDYYGAVFAEGALTEREKALIALAVAHAVQCPYCIDAYTQGLPGKGLQPGGDDRGRSRNNGHSRRRFVGPRRTDAENRGKAFVVSSDSQAIRRRVSPETVDTCRAF